MGTTHTPDTDEYVAADEGSNPDSWHEDRPIPVTVPDTVTVQAFPPRTITTDQVPVPMLPAKVVNEVRTRASVRLCPHGGQVWIGGPMVTPGTGFLLSDGTALTLDTTDAIYAVSDNGQAVMHILSQQRDG